MGVLKGDARLACVDLSSYAERKHEITKQLMEAATTVGCVVRILKRPFVEFPKHTLFQRWPPAPSRQIDVLLLQLLLRRRSRHATRSYRPLFRYHQEVSI